MKQVKYWALLSTLALLFPAGMFARSKNQRTVEFSDAVQVGAAHLKAGDYKVEWQGEGSAVQVKFLKHGTVVATAAATVKVNDPDVTEDAVVMQTKDPNHKVLEEIDFAHQKEAIILQQG